MEKHLKQLNASQRDPSEIARGTSHGAGAVC